MLKPLHQFFLLSFLMLTMAATSQVSVGASNYTTLKAAFDAINAGTHTGTITISITGSTTETATAVLNASGTGAASYTSVAINTTAAATITSNLAGATIRFDGADNVNLNGNGTLQIVNTHTTGAVIHFVNDASGNTIRNATITGNTASYTGTATSPTITAGVIFFDLGSTNGNNGNTIDNCDINGNNQAICLVFSKGLGTSATTTNFQGTVKNSRLYNFLNTGIAGAAAISISASDQWTIQNNSIYLTAAVNTGQQYVFRGILITPNFTSDFHTVTGNFLGGSGPSAAGMMTVTGTGSNVIGMIGLDIETGGTGNLVSNNTVKNITITYNSASGSFSNACIFGFIGGYNGSTTFSGNEVSNVSMTNNGGFVNINGMHLNGRVTAASTTVTPTFNVTNNTITNMTINSGGAAGDVNMHGIRLEASSSASLTTNATSNPTFNVTGNTISNISVPFAGVTSTFIRCIGTVNTQGTSSTAQLFPKVNITNNTIHSNSTASTLANYASGVVTGIHFAGTSSAVSTDVQVISRNTIYNLSATNTGNFGAVVIGILATTGLHDINRNRIYDLKNAATTNGSTSPGLVGITVRSATGASTTANNFISLGTGVTQALQIYGFLQNFNATGPVNVYHNSIYIGGTAGAGDKRSAAVVRGTELFGTGIATPMNVKNNILYNTRTGGAGSQYVIVNSETTPATGFTSDANVLNNANPATLAMWSATNNDLATYKTNSGDATSRTITVNFADVATGDLHLAGASIGDNNLAAAPIAGITVDYDGTTRNPSPVYIGADETATVLPIQLTVFKGHKEGKINKLVWITSGETNNKGFDLERSADGRNFSSIGFIPSKAPGGTSNTSLEYSFHDDRSLAGINYYRLKQTDKDGRTSYISVIVTIKNNLDNLQITTLYPNPAKDVINLAVNAPLTGRGTVSIAHISGTIVKQIPVSLLAGENNIPVNVSTLPSGTYLVTMYDGTSAAKSMRFIKQ